MTDNNRGQQINRSRRHTITAAAAGTARFANVSRNNRCGRCGQSGQATAEYALVMLAAAGLAGMAIAWAVGGDGVARLMDAVIDNLIGEVTG